MMTIQKTAEPYLWKIAQELPYIEHEFSTDVREFTPSFTKIEKQFVKDVLGRSKGVEPLISESQPEVLPLN
jgi:hypothetical protein